MGCFGSERCVFVDDLFKVFVSWSSQMFQHYFDVMLKISSLF